MKILCTGGAGYVGSACLRWLLSQGHDAVAYDNLAEGNREAVPSGRLYEGDILDQPALEAALRDHGSEAVMHFAAVANVPDSIADPDSYWRINTIGTKCVLDAMRKVGVGRLVFSSTAATYGFENEMPLTEDAAQIPKTPYGTSKLAAEHLIGDYSRAYDIGYAIMRYFNASGADPDGGYGEDREKESHLIPLTLQAALGKREKLTIFGHDLPTRDGTCVRDYIHTEDLARAHELAVEAIDPGRGEAYNLGSGEGTTVREVVRACEQASGRPIPCDYAEPRPGDPPVLVASSEKIRRDLGWEPQRSDVCNIVATAWRWHETHPDGYAGRTTMVNR
ncbi:MAG: UDP-glucose 4-epimerase GalE [Phycisphaeraceae bacterium]